MSMRLFAPVPSARVAAETPTNRDRVVDAARAVSLLIVAAGHAVMGVVWWQGGVPKLGNLLAAFPWTQALTWVLQISPLFFFAGGAANAISWDKHAGRGGTYPNWMWARADRLLRPLWVYLVFIGCTAVLVTVFAPQRVAAPLMLLTTQLLWFLGSYILVTALTPFFRPVSPARGVQVTLGLLAGCGLVDVARLFAGWPAAVGLANFILVWSVPAYLGSLRARGALAQYSRTFLVTVLILNLLINAALIKFGPWPLSLVGIPGDAISNMSPPTVVLAVHSVLLVCLVALLNAPLTRVLARPKVWKRITGVNLAAMTLYLWHLPVLVALFTTPHFLGWERPTRLGSNGHPIPDGWSYAFGSVGFWIAFGICVWAVVRLMWPLEHAQLPWWDSAPHASAPPQRIASVLVGVGVAGIGVATLMLSATGLGGFPVRVVHYAGLPLNAATAIVLLVGSGALIRWAGAKRLNPSSF